MKTNIELNDEERLYVVSEGGALSCLPYHVVFAQTLELAKRLRERGVEALNPAKKDIGSLKQYEHYQQLFKLYTGVPDTKTWFDIRTPVVVQEALEALRTNRHRVRIFYGDTATGRSWMYETDVIGRLSRSGRPMRVPMLKVDKLGGTTLLSHCIVRLIDLTTGQEMYRHPLFHLPAMAVESASREDQLQGLTHTVKAEGADRYMESIRSFRTEAKARQWMSFMAGETHSLRRPRLAKAA
jgi:hypothetical protein